MTDETGLELMQRSCSTRTSKILSQLRSVADSRYDREDGAKTDAKTDTMTDVKTDVKADVKADVRTESKADVRTEVKSEVKRKEAVYNFRSPFELEPKEKAIIDDLQRAAMNAKVSEVVMTTCLYDTRTHSVSTSSLAGFMSYSLTSRSITTLED